MSGAQTTQKVFPEVVFEANDLTKTLSVNYGDMVGPTISVVQMLMDKVEEKDAQIADLNNKLETQAAQIAALMARMDGLERKA